MAKYRKTTHSVSNLSCHIVWVTKYRYKVLTGDIKKRCRDILVQVCDSEDVHILKGVVSTGVVTDDMVQDYLEHHREMPNSNTENWIMEGE